MGGLRGLWSQDLGFLLGDVDLVGVRGGLDQRCDHQDGFWGIDGDQAIWIEEPQQVGCIRCCRGYHHPGIGGVAAGALAALGVVWELVRVGQVVRMAGTAVLVGGLVVELDLGPILGARVAV